MAQFSIKYRTIVNGKSYPGTNGATVTASNIWEAKEAFKHSHVEMTKLSM
jgi:hypothetical protein